jgi:ABC-2 type transport system ATP-binding protein
MSAAVETDHLSKDYRVGFWRPQPFRALHELTFTVDKGEVFGLLGPNGAGKTTTLKLLLQLVYPTSGSAKVLGKPVGDLGVKQRIGYLPESPYFYDYLTAEELVGYFAGLFGLGASERRRRVERLLDQVGIGTERRWPLRKLSKGLLQRVGLAQALINEPELVFLDEPMSGLDPLGRRDVRELILQLRDQGRTVIFSSHILSDAEMLCSRIAILVRGRLTTYGRLSDILRLDTLGWELVVEGVAEARIRSLGQAVRKITPISSTRYTIELTADRPPETVLSQLLTAGGRLISLQPILETLEDYFVRQVSRDAAQSEDAAPLDRASATFASRR